MTAVVVRRGRVSVQVERRTLTVVAVLTVLLVALAFAALCYGAGWDDPATVLAALGGGTGESVVVWQWRMPRVLAAVVFGAALGTAGAIFQNLTRNPLGSPDVIGLDAGAYTGALFALTVLSGTSAELTTSAVGTGLAAAAVVYLLSLNVGLSGLRLIVIGIAVNAMLTALNSWIVLRADLEVAIAAVGWSAGSLNGIGWSDVILPFVIIVGLLVVLATQAGGMHQAALGDAIAVTTGVRTGRLRLLMVLVGVGTTATVTAVAGPIMFVALTAPQIGRRLTGAAGVPVLPAAVTGAVLLTGADLVAQVLLAPVALPVGVVTTVLGGCYLALLLTREVRRG